MSNCRAAYLITSGFDADFVQSLLCGVGKEPRQEMHSECFSIHFVLSLRYLILVETILSAMTRSEIDVISECAAAVPKCTSHRCYGLR